MAVPQFPLGIQTPDGEWINIGDKYKTYDATVYSRVTLIEYAEAGNLETITITLSDGNEIVAELDHAMETVQIYRQPQ